MTANYQLEKYQLTKKAETYQADWAAEKHKFGTILAGLKEKNKQLESHFKNIQKTAQDGYKDDALSYVDDICTLIDMSDKKNPIKESE